MVNKILQTNSKFCLESLRDIEGLKLNTNFKVLINYCSYYLLSYSVFGEGYLKFAVTEKECYSLSNNIQTKEIIW